MATGYRLARAGPRHGRSGRLQRCRLDLPQVAVQTVGADDEFTPLGLACLRERRRRVQRSRPVDHELPDARDARQLRLVTMQSPHLEDADPLRRDRPQIAVAPDALGTIGHLDSALDAFGQDGQRLLGLILLDEEHAIRQHDEMDLGAAQPTSLDHLDGIPAAWPRDAVDPGVATLLAEPPGWPRPGRRDDVEVEPAGLRQTLVERLTA